MVSAGMRLINVNSLFPKIEKIGFIVNKSKATRSGITEAKLDETIFDAGIYTEGCSIVRCDRGRKRGDVACYIKHDICCSAKNILSKNIKVTFVDLLLPKTKPISIGTAFRSPKCTNFLQ